MICKIAKALNLLKCGVYSKASYLSNPKEYYRVNEGRLQFVKQGGYVLTEDEDISVKDELSNKHRCTVDMKVY